MNFKKIQKINSFLKIEIIEFPIIYHGIGLVMSTRYEPKTCIRGPKDTSRQNQDVFEIIFFNCWI